MMNSRLIGRRLLTAAICGYLLVVLTAAVAINYLGDRWWPATILLFTPRWLLLAPAPVLFLLAIASHRHRLLSSGILVILAFGLFAVAHFEIPMSVFQFSKSAHSQILVLTLNCDYGRADVGLLNQLLAHYSPDIIQLQGASSRTASVFDQNWHVHRSGQLLTATRFPILASENIEDSSFAVGNSAAMACTIRTPWSVICLVNVHFATPRDGLESVISRWWDGKGVLEANSRVREQQARVVSERAAMNSNPTIISGDFNTPVESAILSVYFVDFFNAFSDAGWGFGNTHFTRRTGVRIDHILASSHWNCKSCAVLSSVGADHRPVLAGLALLSPPIGNSSARSLMEFDQSNAIATFARMSLAWGRPVGYSESGFIQTEPRPDRIGLATKLVR